MAVLIYFHFQPFGERVDDGKPHAVQAAGDLVSAAAEFAARVQFGQNELDRGDPLFVMDARGDAAAVVQHGAGAVLVDGNADGVAVAGQSLVDGVVDDLLHKVMQAALVRRTDIHAGALSDGFQPFQNLYLLLAVNAFNLFSHSESPVVFLPFRKKILYGNYTTFCPQNKAFLRRFFKLNFARPRLRRVIRPLRREKRKINKNVYFSEHAKSFFAKRRYKRAAIGQTVRKTIEVKQWKA